VSDKLEILYPRKEANIRIAPSTKQKAVAARIAEIEASDVYKEYKCLQTEWLELEAAKPRFTCWNCSTEKPLKDLVLYDFVSFSNTIDEDRYDDHNIICPKCGAFSFLKGVKYSDSRFKDNVEVFE
jgi:hypothetical protein